MCNFNGAIEIRYLETGAPTQALRETSLRLLRSRRAATPRRIKCGRNHRAATESTRPPIEGATGLGAYFGESNAALSLGPLIALAKIETRLRDAPGFHYMAPRGPPTRARSRRRQKFDSDVGPCGENLCHMGRPKIFPTAATCRITSASAHAASTATQLRYAKPPFIGVASLRQATARPN